MKVLPFTTFTDKAVHRSRMITPIEAREVVGENLYSFMVTTRGKVGAERSFLQVINYTRLAIESISKSISTKNLQETLFLIEKHGILFKVRIKKRSLPSPFLNLY